MGKFLLNVIKFLLNVIEFCIAWLTLIVLSMLFPIVYCYKALKNDEKNQDESSFCIEKLEKVKARYPRGTTIWSSDRTEDGFEYVSDFINDQIKELKEGE